MSQFDVQLIKKNIRGILEKEKKITGAGRWFKKKKKKARGLVAIIYREWLAKKNAKKM